MSYCSLTNHWSSPAQIALKWTFWGLGWEWSFELLFTAAVLYLSFSSCFQRMMRKADGGGCRSFFWRKKGVGIPWKMGREKKKGNEITIVNLDAILIPEIGWFWQNWLLILFLHFSLVPLIEKNNLCLEIGIGGELHLGSAELLALHHRPNPARESWQFYRPPAVWIIDLVYINYRHFSRSVGRARGRCAGSGVARVEFQERRIWEGKWFNQHQLS